jgi:hypothetical protein
MTRPRKGVTMRRAEAEETFRAGQGPMTDAKLANLVADCLDVRGVHRRVVPMDAR